MWHQLRPYQQTAITNIRGAFARGDKHILLQAPTGSGKTFIFSVLTKMSADKGSRVLILTDRAELLRQAGGSLKKTGLDAFYIQAGCKVVNSSYNAFIAMSQTLRNRIGKQYWTDWLNSIDLVIIDEAHKQEFNYIFESGLLDDKYVIGFTATPKRSGKMRQLALDYQAIIPTIEVRDLIKQDFLVNDDYYGVTSPDMSDVQIDRMKGDYKEGQMFQKFNNPELYEGCVENYQKICPGSKAIVFCVNIEHVIKTCEQFRKSGINARFVVSKMSKPKYPTKETEGAMARYEERNRVYQLYLDAYNKWSGDRQEVFKWFNDTPASVLINAGIATTGFDQPDIETVVVNRATTSTTLWLQMVGRGSRISEGKTHFNILDFGGNADRLGHYSEVREWGLWHDDKGGDGLPPLKECGYDSKGRPIIVNGKKGCRRLIAASIKICPFCGYKYPDKMHIKADLHGILLATQQETGRVIAKKTKLVRDMDLQELIEYRKMKGHKMAWLWRQAYIRGDLKKLSELQGWTSATYQKAENYCLNFV